MKCIDDVVDWNQFVSVCKWFQRESKKKSLMLSGVLFAVELGLLKKLRTRFNEQSTHTISYPERRTLYLYILSKFTPLISFWGNFFFLFSRYHMEYLTIYEYCGHLKALYSWLLLLCLQLISGIWIDFQVFLLLLSQKNFEMN